MVRRNLLCIFFLFYFVSTNYAQYVLKGLVKNNENQPLEGSIVVVSNDSIGGKPLGYVQTNPKGFFEIKMDSTRCWVSVRNLGFEPLIVLIENTSLDSIFNFKLTPNTVLKEVFIKSKRPLIIRHEDTIVYDLGRFRDSTERTVEDLIRHLPGVTVGENGQIKVGEKKVSKVLIEYDDLFGRKYTMGTKNIRADHVVGIEVLHNYQEDAVFRKVNEVDDIAINLTLSDEAKKGVKGTIYGGLGYGAKWMSELQLNIFKIGQKAKYMLISDNGNTGQQYGVEEIEATFSLEELWLELLPVYPRPLVEEVKITTLGLDRQHVDDGFSQFTTLRILKRLKKNWSFKANAYYAKKQDTQFVNSLVRSTAGMQYEWRRQKKESYKNFNGNGDLKISYLSKSNKFSFFSNLEWGTNNHQGDIFFNNLGQTKRNDLTKTGLKTQYLLAAMTGSVRLNDQSVLQVYTKAYDLRRPQNLQLSNDDFSLLFSLDSQFVDLIQNLDLKNQTMEMGARWVLKMPIIVIEVNPHASLNRASLYSSIDIEETLLMDSTEASFNQWGVKGALNFNFKNRWRLKFNTDLAYLKRQDITLNDNKVSLRRKLNVALYKDSGLQSYKIQYGFSTGAMNKNNFFRQQYFINNTNLLNTDYKDLTPNNHMVFGHFSHIDPFSQLNFSVSSRYSYQSNNWIELYDFNNSIISSTPIFAESSSRFVSRIRYSKFVMDLNTSFGIIVRFNYNTSPIIQLGRTEQVTTKSTSLQAETSTLLTHGLRLKLNGSATMQKIQFTEGTRLLWGNEEIASLFYRTKKWRSSIDIRRNQIFFEPFSSTYFASSAEINYSFKIKNKEFIIGLKAINLLKGSKGVFSQSYANEFFLYQTTVTAVPRYFVLSLDMTL